MPPDVLVLTKPAKITQGFAPKIDPVCFRLKQELCILAPTISDENGPLQPA